MGNRLIIVALFCLTLAACTAVTKTQKMDANARPVKDVQIIVRMGYLPIDGVVSQTLHNAYNGQFKAAMTERFSQIFRANDVPVESITVGNNNPISVIEIQSLLNTSKTSHVLILNIESFTYATRYGVKQSLRSVNFNTELWDVQGKHVVWKAHPYLGLIEEQPLLRTQHLAGQLLNGMNTDGLITLKHEHAIDLVGDRISDYYVGTKDR